MDNKEQNSIDQFPTSTKAAPDKQAMAAAGITVVPFEAAEDAPVELQQNDSKV